MAKGEWLAAAVLYVLGVARVLGRQSVLRFAADGCGEEREYDLVSGYGYSLGYLGGGLLFLVNVLMVHEARVVRHRGCVRRRCALSFLTRRGLVGGVHAFR